LEFPNSKDVELALYFSREPITEVLAFFDATDGDVIKSQNLFAIYDAVVGWNGTLK
jgi:hypothetical protein